MREDPAIRDAIRSQFGEDLYVEGIPDTKKLASIVFQDPAALEKLNEIIHPATIADAKRWMAAQQARYVVKESALIFESGAGEGLDLIVCVYAPKSLRIQRVMQRESLSRETVLARMRRQIDEEIKRRLSDRVLINDEQQPLLQQVLSLHEELILLSRN